MEKLKQLSNNIHSIEKTFFLFENMEIHEKLRTIRQSRGLTQDYIAEQLKIDTVNYGRIERGKAKVTVERLIEICHILDIEASRLFEEKESLLISDSLSVQNSEILEKIYSEIRIINKKLDQLLR